MPEHNLLHPYKLCFVAVTAAAFISASDVDASYLPSKYYKQAPLVSTGHSWEDFSGEYYTFNDNSGEILSSYTSKDSILGTSWVSAAYELDKSGKVDEALDVIYDNIDSMLSGGDFIEINRLLGMISITDLSVDLVLGILTSTLPARDRLENRQHFFQIAKECLLSQGLYGEEILVGLD